MSKTVQREFSVAEVVSISRFYNREVEKEETGEKSVLDRLSNLTRWNLKRNINEFRNTVDAFESYNEEMSEEIKSEWFFNDEKADLIEEVMKDEEGNDILDENGKPVTQEMRRIKEEFVDDYDEAMNIRDKRTLEVLSDVNTYSIKTSNIGDEIEKFIDELTDEEFKNIAILLFMDSTEK